jgi:hypothetical protein
LADPPHVRRRGGRTANGADADHFMNHVKRVLIEESWSELEAF